MQRHRPSLGWVINLTMAVIAVYLVTVAVVPQPALVFGLAGLSLAATAWMVVRILKDPYSTDVTFDDQFYADRPDILRSGPE